MPEFAKPTPEAPEYANLAPEVHRTIDQLLDSTWRGEGALTRFDFRDPDSAATVVSTLQASVGSQLPRYGFNEQNEYVKLGMTRVIDERDNFVIQGDPYGAQDPSQAGLWSVWLRRSMAADELPEIQSAQSIELPNKKEAGGLLTTLGLYGLAGYLLSRGQDEAATGAFVAGVSLAGASIIAFVYRTLGRAPQQ